MAITEQQHVALVALRNKAFEVAEAANDMAATLDDVANYAEPDNLLSANDTLGDLIPRYNGVYQGKKIDTQTLFGELAALESAVQAEVAP